MGVIITHVVIDQIRRSAEQPPAQAGFGTPTGCYRFEQARKSLASDILRDGLVAKPVTGIAINFLKESIMDGCNDLVVKSTQTIQIGLFTGFQYGAVALPFRFRSMLPDG